MIILRLALPVYVALSVLCGTIVVSLTITGPLRGIDPFWDAGVERNPWTAGAAVGLLWPVVLFVTIRSWVRWVLSAFRSKR